MDQLISNLRTNQWLFDPHQSCCLNQNGCMECRAFKHCPARKARNLDLVLRLSKQAWWFSEASASGQLPTKRRWVREVKSQPESLANVTAYAGNDPCPALKINLETLVRPTINVRPFSTTLGTDDWVICPATMEPAGETLRAELDTFLTVLTWQHALSALIRTVLPDLDYFWKENILGFLYS